MMNRVLPTIAAIFAAALLQVGLAPYIAIAGVVPNILQLVVVTLALVEGPAAGAAAGFGAGLAFDLLGAGPVGPMVLVLTVIGYGAGLLHENMFAEGWLLPLTVLAVASLASALAYGLLLDVLGAGGPFLLVFFTKMLPEALYDTALALLVYPWLARLLRQDRPMKTFRRLA
jgi:rod shape-determining protein MreD